jgi:hypothetical protein
MQDFEKLGIFYLGRKYDLASGKTLDEPVLYDSRDLVTHAVCMGMTGSGKTGLCLTLIEEAALDGVPVIAIDPKGDLGNLLLSFPRLAASDFRPWIDEEEARRAGKTPDEYAAAEAQKWTEGLVAWGQDGARIDRLRRAAEFAIYTPGSRAGLPVSVLSSFAAPAQALRDDAEAMTERAGNIATSVLALAGVDAAPRSREHTLVTMLLTSAWREGRDVDMAGLIHLVQSPPFETVGVIALESYYPSTERFDLAVRLNELIAAPGFGQWLQGDSLDPASLLRTPDGKPRVTILSIAHLGDPERMFFVSLLLNQIVGWMRAQSGTTSLRALVYMDEIFGYFPPIANPPSKGPLLTLLKQGRAFGIGAVLATQNPVDLDYKGLANTGTWFLGRLQTERDKGRVLDGLEGAAAGAIDRAELDRILSALTKRVFLMHNVHEPGPIVFQTRWALSYLRGPLSRDQIKRLTVETGGASAGSAATSPESMRTAVAGIAAAAGAALGEEPAAPKAPSRDPEPVSTRPPVVPPGIPQFFLPTGIPEPGSRPAGSGSRATYLPVILGAARIDFSDLKLGIDQSREVVYAAPVPDGALPVDWAAATALPSAIKELRSAAPADAAFLSVPDAALRPKNYARWEKAFARWLSKSERIELLRFRDLKLTSRPGETERDFRARVQDTRRAARDEAVDALRKKFAPKQAQLTEQLRRAEAAKERETEQASEAKVQTAVSMGATLLGALLGRKAVSTGTLGRATTAARGVGRSRKESEDIRRAGETVEAVRARIRETEAQLLHEKQRIVDALDVEPDIERIQLAPKRGQVAVQVVALGWVPAGEADATA